MPFVQKLATKNTKEQTKTFAADWPAQSIRLDAYNSIAGVGDFYRKCGYTKRGNVKYRGNHLYILNCFYKQENQ